LCGGVKIKQMSKVKTKKLRRVGINIKSERRKARKYILGFVKCNRGYGYNNIAFNMGKLDSFCIFSSALANEA